MTRETLDGEWSDPVPTANVYPVENLEAIDLHNPVYSVDGLRMTFGSKLDAEDFNLFSARRETVGEPFGNVSRLEVSRPEMQEEKGVLSFDERTLFFARHQSDFRFPQLYVAHRETTDDSFGSNVALDRFSLGRSSRERHEDAEAVNFAAATWAPAVAPDWPTDGSKLYFSTTCCGDNFDIYEATWRQATPILGDMTSDGAIDDDDVAIITKAAQFAVNAPGFDLNTDGAVNGQDRMYLISDLANTYSW